MKDVSTTLLSRPLRLLGTASLLAVIAACASTPPPANITVPVMGPTPVADGSAAPGYQFLLAAGDEFDVKMPDSPQYDQTVKVRPDGAVSLAILGDIHAAGRTPEDVQADIRSRYATLAGADKDREYLIHANDDLEIKLPYYKNLDDAMRVRPDGKIQVQLVGTLDAEGHTPEELESELSHRYSRYLREPEVTVIVKSATSQMVRTASGVGRGGVAGQEAVVIVRTFQAPQIFITGEVAKPGMVVYTPGMTLLQVLAQAGGNLPSGDVTKLVILRRTSTQTADVMRPALTKNYRSAPTRDVALQPYDVILLPPTRAQTLAEALDRYVYKLIAPIKNSSFSYVYGRTQILP